MGGYVASCALRAAGESTEDPRPAAFSCHYLGVAEFGEVDLRVSTRKRGRAATSQRVEVRQADRPILDAMVWSVADVEGLEHDETTMPDVPGPQELAWSPTTPRRRSPSGTTSMPGRSTSRSSGRPRGLDPHGGTNGCGSRRRRRSTTSGSTRCEA
jgi:acyl-CoA thioesterase-2